eukprot:3175630-Lingulodinium_polyedra.AAC.1
MIREILPPAEPEIPVTVHGPGGSDVVNPACPTSAAVRGGLPRNVCDTPSGPNKVKSRSGLSVGT